MPWHTPSEKDALTETVAKRCRDNADLIGTSSGRTHRSFGKPIDNLNCNLPLQMQHLRRTRALLLPRLLSGQVTLAEN